KGASEAGFDLYSNAESAKGREIAENPRVALCFHWKTVRRQVRVRGTVSLLPTAEIDGYFASRSRGSRIGAWASRQSRPVESRDALKAEVEKYEAEFESRDVPRPEHWVGWRLTPTEVEFWVNQPFRLHDRLLFTRATPEEAWEKRRLYP
ncbi:MAG: pyridoxamine 5'-phosphate oxidase, partial [Pseudomonadota bacterium]